MRLFASVPSALGRKISKMRAWEISYALTVRLLMAARFATTAQNPSRNNLLLCICSINAGQAKPITSVWSMGGGPYKGTHGSSEIPLELHEDAPRLFKVVLRTSVWEQPDADYSNKIIEGVRSLRKIGSIADTKHDLRRAALTVSGDGPNALPVWLYPTSFSMVSLGGFWMRAIGPQNGGGYGEKRPPVSSRQNPGRIRQSEEKGKARF